MESQGSSLRGCVTGKTAFTDEEHASNLLIQIFIACKHNTQSESAACELSITNKHQIIRSQMSRICQRSVSVRKSPFDPFTVFCV